MVTRRIKEIDSDAVKSRVSYALGLFIGPGRQHSYADAALLVQIDQRTVESHVRGENPPRLDHYFRYALVLGEEFANRVQDIADLTSTHTETGFVPAGKLRELAQALRKTADEIEQEAQCPEDQKTK